MLQDCPSLSVDIDAWISELSRRPHTARRLLIEFANQVVKAG